MHNKTETAVPRYKGGKQPPTRGDFKIGEEHGIRNVGKAEKADFVFVYREIDSHGMKQQYCAHDPRHNSHIYKCII